jgi:CxxC motif-containing protein (DUF1111 family)
MMLQIKDRIGVSACRSAGIAVLVLTTLWFVSVASAQTDPGPRGGTAGAGNHLSGLSPNQIALFTDGQGRFQEVENVPNNGLGPRFNSTSCSSCHLNPAVGGSSPQTNPQVQFANSQNTLPFFITLHGPVREARFIHKPDGTPDGGVHDLFTIAGRSDTPSGCNLNQESFTDRDNISLRIPTPTFGLGLIEAVSDATLVSNLISTSNQRGSFGISGRFNRSGNDGTITRFGWKAQNKSLHIFTGEAYNVEMGITNLLFPNERDDTVNCNPFAAPNDIFNLGSAGTAEFDDVTAFAAFMRFLAPPARGPIDNTVVQGSNQFVNIGCAFCHTSTLMTGPSQFGPALSNQQIHPYSDFAIHNMGPGLADQISQGLAGGDEFRTAPLWGLGQRLFFLHDGRETDLMDVIQDHASQGNSQFGPSEANRVVQNFNNLSRSDQQAILNFLRSL